MTMDSPRPTAIELRGVTKSFRTRSGRGKVVALDGVDLAVEAGETFGLVGESGSGKTTAGRLMVRLDNADAGVVRVAGADVRRLRGKALKAFRRTVQMIFQDPYQSLNPYMSVADTVGEPLIIAGEASPAERRQKIRQMLTTVGLNPPEAFLRRYPHQLSGGQRQRVAIARAMVLDPGIMVADEPTSMLDASMAVQIYQLLAQIQTRRAMTMVFITHSLAAAHYLCDRIAVIYRGCVMEYGPAATVIFHPRHPYTQALMDALPRYGRPGSQRRYDALRPEPRSGTFPDGCVFFDRCNRADPDRCAHRRPALASMGDGVSAACFLAAPHRSSGKENSP
jgi:oligopeptide/dipeptide ABC transporter ATP-binding protein